MGDIDVYPPQNVSAQTPMLAYAERTTAQASISAEVDVSLSVTVTVPAGRRIRITGHSQVTNDATAGVILGYIKQDNVEVGRWVVDTIGASQYVGGHGETVVSPAAGTHTYKLTLWKFNGAGTVTLDATANYPAYILVEDITGSQLPVLPQSVPVGQLGYAFTTASLTGAAAGSEVDVPGLSVNIAVPAGRTIRITASAVTYCNTVPGRTDLKIMEGATFLNNGESVHTQVGWGQRSIATAVISPSAGAHTYKVVLKSSNNQGFIYADANVPAYLLVEDISPTPAPGQGAPGSTLGYAEVTADQTGFTADTDITGMTCTVTVPAGRRIRVSGKLLLASTIAGDRIRTSLKEGAAVLNLFDVTSPVVNSTEELIVSHVLTPSAGTHTYKVSVQRLSGTGTIGNFAAATYPSFILVEDITGAVWPVGSTVTAGMVASEAWTTYVPVITQSGAVAATVSYARYQRVGRLITVAADLAVTGTGGSGSIISVTIPIAPVYTSSLTAGVAAIFDASANLWYQAVAEIFSTTEVRFRSAASTANARLGQAASPFGAALASGDVVGFTVTYEAAS